VPPSTVENDSVFVPLPDVSIDHLSGFIEALVHGDRQQKLSVLARRLLLDIDDLLPILDAVQLLEFALINDGNISATDAGRAFANGTIRERKQFFREQVLSCAPMITFIIRLLQQDADHEQDADVFLKTLQAVFPSAQANRQFATATNWGQYAELFEYNATTRRVRLEPIGLH